MTGGSGKRLKEGRGGEDTSTYIIYMTIFPTIQVNDCFLPARIRRFIIFKYPATQGRWITKLRQF